MWQRFTERARKVVFFAQEEAGRLGENYVSTEHLLLGLIRENDTVAARILDKMGVSLGRVRSEIERRITRGNGRLGQDMQLTPQAKRAMDLAHNEALQLTNAYIGTEHLLLGLIREGDGMAAQVLADFGIFLEAARLEVKALQGEGEGYGKSDRTTKPEPNKFDPRPGRIPFSNSSSSLLLIAEAMAVREDSPKVRPEHLLLALVMVTENRAHQALTRLGITRAKVVEEIRQVDEDQD
jgi:ATP-dependent Clp protease ATP-binding subunit ClpA